MAAFVILRKVATTAAHSDDLLHAPAVNALSPEDRNLTMTLVLGVLRWQLALDATIRPMLQRPDAEMHPAALLALRLGVFQLQHLQRIPAHAAINESVELARANGAEHTAGLVNALLRRLLREAGEPKRQTLAAASPAEIAHPHWLLQRWRALYGGKATRSIATYDQAEPPSHELFANDSSGAMPPIDDGSRLIAELAAAAHPEPKRILDCCAAPGGKTRILARRFPEAEIVAIDVSERRLDAMRKRLDADPAASHVRTVLADMTKRHIPSAVDEPVPDDEPAEAATMSAKTNPLSGLFDLILVDAPCSGTGTLARNPEIRHRLELADLQRQAERQTAILRNALRRLAPGGRLVYSTCSLEPEENEGVVDAVLAEGRVKVLSAAAVLDNIPALHADTREQVLVNAVTPAGALRTLPGVHPCDGFYAAVLEKP